MLNVDLPLGEVDMLPIQGQDLVSTHSGSKSEQHGDVDIGVAIACRTEELLASGAVEH